MSGSNKAEKATRAVVQKTLHNGPPRQPHHARNFSRMRLEPFGGTSHDAFRLSPEGARARHRLKRRCVWKE